MEVPCASLGKERVFQIEGKASVKTGVGACLEYSRNIREMSVAGRGSRSEKSGQQGLGGQIVAALRAIARTLAFFQEPWGPTGELRNRQVT